MPFNTNAVVSSGKTQQTVRITSTQSWTAPTGVTSVEVILCGGGGSGAVGTTNSVGITGGHGSVMYSVLTVSPGTAYTVTIGGGGAAVTNAGALAGNAGSASSFGALLTVNGGGAGNISGAANAGPTGFGGSGATIIRGQASGNAGGATFYPVPPTPGYMGLAGGGGVGVRDATTNGNVMLGVSGGGVGGCWNIGTGAATAGIANSGAGGGGTDNNGSASWASGAGGSGICIIKYWA